ncbi:hypothetical protein GALMADRAFT_1167416 [Galerina marginata CBS 339.88]|uniref:Uncharacterized protein n=1 Tax=Galerina marginata (strain CBS 339.88) TaxID=685588 RepID=A0A067TLR1_GALM3|nr:hypothetical protein GALMADRAFT_1167416 [Galerina marginata CBS 339.88]
MASLHGVLSNVRMPSGFRGSPSASMILLVWAQYRPVHAVGAFPKLICFITDSTPSSSFKVQNQFPALPAFSPAFDTHLVFSIFS